MVIRLALSILRAYRPILLFLDNGEVDKFFELIKTSHSGSQFALLWEGLLIMHLPGPNDDELAALSAAMDAYDWPGSVTPEDLVDLSRIPWVASRISYDNAQRP